MGYVMLCFLDYVKRRCICPVHNRLGNVRIHFLVESG